MPSQFFRGRRSAITLPLSLYRGRGLRPAHKRRTGKNEGDRCAIGGDLNAFGPRHVTDKNVQEDADRIGLRLNPPPEVVSKIER